MFSIFINSIIFENIVLTKYLGLCPFVGASCYKKKSLNLGITTTIIMVIVSLITFVINKYILMPYSIEHFKTIVFILVIASIVQIVNIIIKNKFNKIHKSFGIYLPLIATNCAVFGTTLINANLSNGLLETFIYSLGSGIGFTLLISIYAEIRERINLNNIPKSFKGVPIAFVVASIIILIFKRF